MFLPTVTVNGWTPKKFGWLDDVFAAPRTNAFFPMDTYEDEDEDNVCVAIEAPGMDKDSINVSVKNGMLTIVGEKRQVSDIKYITRQTSSAVFSKEFSLDPTLDTEKIAAEYENGVLLIKIAKKPVETPKRIDIKFAKKEEKKNKK